jgi:hypothetical protein
MIKKAIVTFAIGALACGAWVSTASAESTNPKHHKRAQATEMAVTCPKLPAPGGCVDPSEIKSSKNHHTTPMPGNNPMANAGAGH